MRHFLKSSSGNFFLKATALVLILVLNVTTSTQAAPFPTPANFALGDFKFFAVPSELGIIRDSYFTPDFNKNAPLIIHIQDAHGQFEAQEHIRKILQHLEKEMGIKLALVEGASTPLSSELFHIFPDRKLNKKIAETLARRAELSGIELFLLDSKTDFRAAGIEDPDLYRDNLNTFKKVYEQLPLAERFLARLKNYLEQALRRTANGELRRFLSTWMRFGEERMDLIDFARLLAREAGGLQGIDLLHSSSQSEWPHLQRLLLLDKVRKEINERETGREYKKLGEVLKSAGVSAGLIDSFKTLQSIKGKERPRAILERVFDRIPDKSFSFLNYPNFRNFAAVKIFQDELDGAPLYAEILRLSDLILSRLARTEREKEMVRLSSELNLLRDFTRLELTREGYDFYRMRRESLQPDVLRERFKAIGVRAFKIEVNIPFVFGDVEHFYEIAERRESIFMEKALIAMNAAREKRAALLAGGFHTEGLMKLLKARGISYVVITPRMKTADSRSKYVASLTNAREPGLDDQGKDDHLDQSADSSLAGIIKFIPYENWQSTIRTMGGDPDETRRQVWQAVDAAEIPATDLSKISNRSVLGGSFSAIESIGQGENASTGPTEPMSAARGTNATFSGFGAEQSNRLMELLSLNGDVLHARLHQLRAQERHKAPKGNDAIALFRNSRPGEAFLLSRLPTPEEWYRLKGGRNGLQHSTLDAYEWNGKRWYVLTKGDFFFSRIQPFEKLQALFEIHTHPSVFNLLLSTAFHATASKPDFKRAKERGIPSYVELAHRIFQYGVYPDGAPHKTSWWKIPLTRYRWPNQNFPNLLTGPGLVLQAAGPTAHPVWSYIKRHISLWAFLFDIAHMVYLHLFLHVFKIPEFSIEFPQGWMKYERQMGLQEMDRRYGRQHPATDMTEKLFLVPLWSAAESQELEHLKRLGRKTLSDRVHAVRGLDGLSEQIKNLDQELGGYDAEDKGFGADAAMNADEIAVRRFHIDRAIFGTPVRLKFPETIARPVIVKQRDRDQAIIAKHYSRGGDRFNIYVDDAANQWHAVRLKGRLEVPLKPLPLGEFPGQVPHEAEHLEQAFLSSLMSEAVKSISENGKLTPSYISFDYSKSPDQEGVWAHVEGTKRVRVMSLPPTARRIRQIQTLSNGRMQGALHEALGMLRLLVKHPEYNFYWLGYDQRAHKFTVHDVKGSAKKKITLSPDDKALPFDGTEMADYFALDPDEELVVIGEDGRHTEDQLVRKNVNAMALLANTLGQKLYFYFDRIEGANQNPGTVARKIIETAAGRGVVIPEEMIVMFEHSHTGEAGMFMVESRTGLHFTDTANLAMDRQNLNFDVLVKKFAALQLIQQINTPSSGFGNSRRTVREDNPGEVTWEDASPAKLKEQFGTRRLDSTELRKIASVLSAQKVFYPDAFDAIQEMRRLESAQEWGIPALGNLILAYKIKNNGRWAFEWAGLKFKQEKIRSLKRQAFVTSLTRDAGELRFLNGRVWFSAKKLIPQLSEEYPDEKVRRELKALLEIPGKLEEAYHGAPAVVYVVDGVPVAADLFRNDRPREKPLRVPFSLVFRSTAKFSLADSFYSILTPARLGRAEQSVVVKRFDRFKSISYGGIEHVINKGKSSRFDYAGHIGLVGHRGLRPVWAAIAKKENPASYLIPPVEYSMVFALSDQNALRPVMSYERNLKAARMRTFKNHVIMTRLTKEGRLVLGGRTWGRFTHYRNSPVLVRLLNGVPVSVRVYDKKGAHKIGEESLALIYKRAVAGGPFTLVHSFHRHAFPRKARGTIKYLSSPNGTFIPLHSDQGLIVVKKLSEKGSLALGHHVWIQLDKRFGGWPAFIEIKDGAVVSKGLFARGTDIASLHGSSRLPIVLIHPTHRRAEKLLAHSSGFGTSIAGESDRAPLELLAGFDHRPNGAGRLSLHSYSASHGASEKAVLDVMKVTYDLSDPSLEIDKRLMGAASKVDAARWTEHILIQEIRERLGLTDATVEKAIESYGQNSYLLNTGKLSTKPQVLVTDFDAAGNRETVEELAQDLPKGSVVVMFMNNHSGLELNKLLSGASLSGITVERMEGFVNEKDVRSAFRKYTGRVADYQKKLFISSAHSELLKRDLQAGDVLAFEFDAALILFRRAAVRLVLSLSGPGEALRTPAGDLPLSFENFGQGHHAFLTPYFAKLTELLLEAQVSAEVRKAA